MKKGILLSLFIVAIIYSHRLVAQPGISDAGGQPEKGIITGRVLDASTQEPIEYANIILRSKYDSLNVTGTITGSDGTFFLTGVPLGEYQIEVDFIGYRMKTLPDIRITPEALRVSLGEIYLEQTSYSTEAVEVIGERPPVMYKLEKKVVDVSRQFTATSGTAVDVLKNVPSVTVDIEGNMRLRGSGNFTVLIDGTPTILEPSEILQQLPANGIETIEIITNPSAKYDPEGTAGIINVIMKKNRNQGLSGVLNLNAGLEDKHGGDVLLNYRNSKYSGYVSGNYSRRYYPGVSQERNQTTRQEVTSFVASEGQARRGRSGFWLRAGATANLSRRDNITFGFRYGDRKMERTSDLNYEQWNSLRADRLTSLNKSETTRSGNFYAATLDYKHRFSANGHELSAQFVFNNRETDEANTNELREILTNEVLSGRQTLEEGPSRRLQLRVDYTRPFGSDRKLELGYQSRFGKSEDVTSLLDYDTLQAGYTLLPEFSRTTHYQRDIHSLYALYGGQGKQISYQAGLRGEYTYRKIDQVGEREQFTINRWDYFPTLHLSYKFPKGQQFMTSYSRRIERPRGWFLEPFETWDDAYNVRKGNPDLDPEYIDSYEMGYQTFWGKNVLSAEFYYRVSHNKIERIRSAYSDNITLHTFANVGTDYAFGSEFMVNADIFPWWNVNYMANLFNYRVRGEIFGESFDRESFNWNIRANNSFRVARGTEFQLNGIYNSPTVSSQGRQDGFFSLDVAMRHDFVPNLVSAVLQIRDLFATAKFESTTAGPGYYSYNYYHQNAPIVILDVRVSINNFRPERRRANQREEMDDDEF